MAWAAALGGAAGASGGGQGGLLGNLFGYQDNVNQQINSTTTGNSTTTSLSQDEINQLNTLINTLQQNGQQYSRQNAITDAQGFADQAIKTMKEQGLPAIATQQKSAGAYDSTATTQQSNDLQARTAAAISANTANVVTQYANAQAQNEAQIAALYSILKGASTTSDSTQTTKGTQNQQSDNSGGTWGQLTGSLSHGLGQVGHVGSSIGHGFSSFMGSIF